MRRNSGQGKPMLLLHHISRRCEPKIDVNKIISIQLIIDHIYIKITSICFNQSIPPKSPQITNHVLLIHYADCLPSVGLYCSKTLIVLQSRKPLRKQLSVLILTSNHLLKGLHEELEFRTEALDPILDSKPTDMRLPSTQAGKAQRTRRRGRGGGCKTYLS